MTPKYTFILSFFVICLSCQPEEIPQPQDNSIPTFSTTISVIQDEVNGENFVIAGSKTKNLVVSFHRNLPDGTMLEFLAIHNDLPNIMEDQEGNIWNMYGTAIEGPRKGQQLLPSNSCMGYWFSFGTMYPELEIYEGEISTPVSYNMEAHPDWTIPTDFVFQGASFDAIGSIENPDIVEYNFKNDPEDTFFLNNDDMVIGVQIGEEIRAYPHSILNYHEIINDEMNGTKISIIYCPLTGTAKTWNREIDGIETTFGVSGRLYNSNILAFDRITNSYWNQLNEDCVFGPLKGAQAERFSMVETTWGTWKSMYKFPKVVSPITGADRNYNVYPYGDYNVNHDYIAYPITYLDERLPSKERVHAIIVDGKAKAYQLKHF